MAWIDGVATTAARWPLGQRCARATWRFLAVAAAAAVAARARVRPPQRRHVSVARGAALVAIVVLGHAAAAAGGHGVIDGESVGPVRSSGRAAARGGGRRQARREEAVAGLRDRGVKRLDLVVLRTAAPAATEVATALRRRWPGVLVLGPAGSAVAARRLADLGSVAVPAEGSVIDVGGLRLTVDGSERAARCRRRAPSSAGLGEERHRCPADSFPTMIASAPPPLPRVELALTLGDRTFDLRWRALVGGDRRPRFGRESEVLATVRAAGQAGADIAVTSLPPRLVGPATRAGGLPVAARVSSLEAVEAASEAGAALVLVPADLVDAVADTGTTMALLVEDVGEIDRADLIGDRPVPLAVDTSATANPEEALAIESVAVPWGCRLLCTTNVRRTRRVVETVAALLAAQRRQDDRQ